MAPYILAPIWCAGGGGVVQLWTVISPSHGPVHMIFHTKVRCYIRSIHLEYFCDWRFVQRIVAERTSLGICYQVVQVYYR